MIASFSKLRYEAGCDEAGRGCLAGPVFAAAVILPRDFNHPKLNDSKKLSAKTRIIIRDYIERHAISFAVASVDESEIDKINILNASLKAMHICISQLSVSPEYLLIDGIRFIPFRNIPHTCIVQGDAKYASIAAASILAKTYRDEHMCDLANQYPEYGWVRNKGYGTLEHRKAITQMGLSPYHRKTFKLKSTPSLF